MSSTRYDTLLETSDSLSYKKGRVKSYGKETTVNTLYPYGLTANPPVGSLCISWAIEGEESNRAGIMDFPNIRPKNLQPGEVVVSNYLTGSEVRFKANGDIDISSGNKINITATDIVITGAVEITGTITNNGTTIGDDHIHSQGADSDGDSEVDTGTPHS